VKRPKLRKPASVATKKMRKEAQKRLGQQISSMLAHPTECVACKKEFDRTVETVKTWHVRVAEESKTVELMCPLCWDTLIENKDSINHGV
jgi:hypothetical protein